MKIEATHALNLLVSARTPGGAELGFLITAEALIDGLAVAKFEKTVPALLYALWWENDMPITAEEEEKLSHILNELNANRSKINDWERGFLDDNTKRYEEHGAKISLSPKQWGVLNKMYEKVTEK